MRDARPGRREPWPDASAQWYDDPRPVPLGRGTRSLVLRSAPVAVGLAAMAAATAGALVAAQPGAAGTVATARAAAHARPVAGGAAPRSSLLAERQATVSRSSRRTRQPATRPGRTPRARLVREAEVQARSRTAALARLTRRADAEAAEIARNLWVLPMAGYRLTARFGAYGLWSSSHTGLDFAAPTGTPIVAVAAGTVAEVGYNVAYGNKTVVVLPDGTELWFCHQASYAVSVGQVVRPGQVIGYVGSTGNTTGPHLHLEVRPGGKDPVDPYTALVAHGLQP